MTESAPTPPLHSGHSDTDVPVSAYVTVFLALLVLTALTTWAAFLDLGRFHTPVALAIAVTKALLVALIFMHLRYSSPLTWVAVCAGLIWLAVMMTLTLSDYLSRPWMPSLGT